MLDSTNYQTGFMMDQELLGGVCKHPEIKDFYLAYVVRHTTGETLGSQAFPLLHQALDAIQEVRRAWKFETAKGCNKENCDPENCSNHGSPKCRYEPS